jgi:hypothetical protein
VFVGAFARQDFVANNHGGKGGCGHGERLASDEKSF